MEINSRFSVKVLCLEFAGLAGKHNVGSEVNHSNFVVAICSERRELFESKLATDHSIPPHGGAVGQNLENVVAGIHGEFRESNAMVAERAGKGKFVIPYGITRHELIS